MKRRLTAELMDDPAVPHSELAASLSYLRTLNRWLGNRRILFSLLRSWSARWPKDQPITLLDIATGSADIPLAIRAWALARGHDLRITAIDCHESTLAEARTHIEKASRADPRLAEGITLLRADAKDLLDRFGPQSFDYVHTSLFLHHLHEVEALTVLRIMDRLARRGIIWNDLVRSRLHRLLTYPATFLASPIVKHDARVSVEAGFTRREVMEYARRLDLTYARYIAPPLWYRFVFAGERPAPLDGALR